MFKKYPDKCNLSVKENVFHAKKIIIQNSMKMQIIHNLTIIYMIIVLYITEHNRLML